jgi:hypothetical protein
MRVRWAVFGFPVATALMAAGFGLLGVLHGTTAVLGQRPGAFAFGAVPLMFWWHLVVRPRHRWWALATAIAVTVPAYLVLHSVVLVLLAWPWDGILSFALACWLGSAAYVGVTRQATIPFARDPAPERSEIAPGETYEVRFGWTRRDMLLVPASVLFVIVGVAMRHDKPVPAIVAIALGGVFLLIRLIGVISGRVALRVDATGVTLGMMPPWPASYTATVPWKDIEAIVLWRQDAGRTTIPYIGLQRRPGLTSLPGSVRSGALKRISQFVAAHVPPEVVADSRPVTMWRLHEPTLRAAIGRFAPTVDIVDLT